VCGITGSIDDHSFSSRLSERVSVSKGDRAAFRFDSIRPALGETRETACLSVRFRKLGKLQETKLERFRKLDGCHEGS
jgi:hypothetical protein